ncbi:MAG TPA: carboxymuconolactone decarboxylase family protein [Terriglobia bacterium]|nr:carboxymuconolactone decarboxylase family protein [Terriglobia bacterium]
MDGSEERGLEMLRRMLGEERARQVRESWTKLSPDFARYVTNFLAGDVWARPNLDLKTRSLITVSALTALGRSNALRLNIEMALNNGATRAEILETLLQMAPYAGFPACWDALLIADEVFKQQEGKKA